MSGMDFFIKEIIVDSILTPFYLTHLSSDLHMKKKINKTDCIKTTRQDISITCSMKLNEIL